MAGDTYSTPPLTNDKGGYSENDHKVSVLREDISENIEDAKQIINGKPPRHLSVVRHSISTTTLVSPIDFVSEYF